MNVGKKRESGLGGHHEEKVLLTGHRSDHGPEHEKTSRGGDPRGCRGGRRRRNVSEGSGEMEEREPEKA